MDKSEIEKQPLPASQAHYLATHTLLFDEKEKMYRPVKIPEYPRE